MESVFWYSGRMHHSGTLLRLKQHAHNIIYKESIFFAATPAQLGLTKENKLLPTHPYQVVRTKEAGFANNVELKKFILEKLKKSHDNFDGELSIVVAFDYTLKLFLIILLLLFPFPPL